MRDSSSGLACRRRGNATEGCSKDKAALAALAADAEAAAPAERSEAEVRVASEANLLEEGQTRLARARSAVERTIEGGRPDAVRGAIDAARAELDPAMSDGLSAFRAAVEALDRLEKSVALASLRRFAAEGGVRRVPRVYFAVAGDRILPSAAPALDDVVNLLGMYPELALEIAVRPAGIDGPSEPPGLAAERVAEVSSYLVQQGVARERIRRLPKAPREDALPLEPLVIHPRATPEKEGEDGRITLRVVEADSRN